MKVKVLNVDGWDADWSIVENKDYEIKEWSAEAIARAIVESDDPDSPAEREEIEDFLDGFTIEEHGDDVMSFMTEGDGYHCIKLS